MWSKAQWENGHQGHITTMSEVDLLTEVQTHTLTHSTTTFWALEPQAPPQQNPSFPPPASTKACQSPSVEIRHHLVGYLGDSRHSAPCSAQGGEAAPWEANGLAGQSWA